VVLKLHSFERQWKKYWLHSLPQGSEFVKHFTWNELRLVSCVHLFRHFCWKCVMKHCVSYKVIHSNLRSIKFSNWISEIREWRTHDCCSKNPYNHTTLISHRFSLDNYCTKRLRRLKSSRSWSVKIGVCRLSFSPATFYQLQKATAIHHGTNVYHRQQQQNAWNKSLTRHPEYMDCWLRVYP